MDLKSGGFARLSFEERISYTEPPLPGHSPVAQPLEWPSLDRILRQCPSEIMGGHPGRVYPSVTSARRTSKFACRSRAPAQVDAHHARDPHSENDAPAVISDHRLLRPADEGSMCEHGPPWRGHRDWPKNWQRRGRQRNRGESGRPKRRADGASSRTRSAGSGTQTGRGGGSPPPEFCPIGRVGVARSPEGSFDHFVREPASTPGATGLAPLRGNPAIKKYSGFLTKTGPNSL